MFAAHGKLFHHGPAIELLAQASHVSIDEVARLYGSELARLEVGARIQAFLPIFALRNVREMLRQRGAAKQPVAQAGEGWNGWTGTAPGALRGARLDARLLTHRAAPASARQLNCTGGGLPLVMPGSW